MSSRRVLVATADWVGKRMAGPGIRAMNIARELAVHGFEVTLAAPNEIDTLVDGVATFRLGAYDARGAIALARRHDAVVTQRLPARAMVALARTPIRVVYDLYDPPLPAAIAARQHRVRESRARLVAETALLTGDAFICASERQRDLWLGALGTLGRLDRIESRRDPSFRQLIDVVPFGMDVDRPMHNRSVMRGVLPGVDERSRILLWAGGMWPWLDPLTVIRAVYELSRERSDVRLVFMGVRRPNSRAAEKETTAQAMAVARELGLMGTTVIFNEEWVPYEHRASWLLEANVGVSAHFDTLETRFAFRTRLLDYLWSGLPIATTQGDVLSELVERERLGACLPPQDAEAWALALSPLLEGGLLAEGTGDRIRAVRKNFEWPRVVEPLARLLAEPGRTIPLPQRARLAGPRELVLRGRTLATRSGLDAVGAVVSQKTPHARR